MQRLIKILATWFGCGLAPQAPGTVGTLGAIPLVMAFSYLNTLHYMIATVTFAVLAIFVAHLYELMNGAGQHDRQEIVIDEVAGFLVTMTWVPLDWRYLLVGFVVFRFFDALKPFPISYIDRNIKGGVGVVADDLVAGILSNIILQALLQMRFL